MKITLMAVRTNNLLPILKPIDKSGGELVLGITRELGDESPSLFESITVEIPDRYRREQQPDLTHLSQGLASLKDAVVSRFIPSSYLPPAIARGTILMDLLRAVEHKTDAELSAAIKLIKTLTTIDVVEKP